MPTAGHDSLAVDLSEKVAIVTGATRGIGKSIAEALARAGAGVVVNGRSRPDAVRVVEGIRTFGGRAEAAIGDVGDAGVADLLISRAVDHFGRLDILVNNAALTDTFGDFLAWSDRRVDETLRTNLRGAILCSQRAARVMSAHARGGAIINITSVGGSQRAHQDNVVYDVAKGGLDALTRALAVDLGPKGIRVNAVGPAAINESDPSKRGGDLPLRRGGTPGDVAAAVLYLASDAASFVTGQILYIDGGLSAQLRSPGLQSRAQLDSEEDLRPS